MKTHKRLPKALLPHPRHKGSIVRNQVHGELNRQFEHQEVVLLVGMPAIGKTTCAVQYAESHVGTQYDHLIWLNLQQHPYELATTLALRLAEHTDRHITPKIDHQNCEQHLTSLLLQCSGATDGKLLLVLDHFTQSLFTDDVLHTTVLGDQWDILVVCTHPDDLPGFPSVMVPSLTLEESVSLFGSGYQGCETATSYNDIKELCTLLEGHPFVIVLYANLLSANPELTVQKLIHHVQLRAISPDFISRINTHYDKIKQKKEEVVIIRRNRFEGLELDDDSNTFINNTTSSIPKQSSANKSHVTAYSTVDNSINDDGFITIERKISKNDIYKPKKNRT
jgi:hypothetical protein